jgi:hypothetical protein
MPAQTFTFTSSPFWPVAIGFFGLGTSYHVWGGQALFGHPKAGPEGAAAKLGIPRSTLDWKIKQLRIKKHKLFSDSSKALFLVPENPALPEFLSSNFSSKPFVTVLCVWPPCCIFVHREPRRQQCSNAMTHWTKQQR